MGTKALTPASHTSYDEDFAAWASETASLLRAGRFSELDIEHVAEEIEDMAKWDRREVRSRARVITARIETRLPSETFPRACPFTPDQILDLDFPPE